MPSKESNIFDENKFLLKVFFSIFCSFFTQEINLFFVNHIFCNTSIINPDFNLIKNIFSLLMIFI